jgi:hypothetical protein
MSTGFSTFDVGNCGCGDIPCMPCDIPASNLTLSWTDTGAGGSVTLTFNAAGPSWQVTGVSRTGGQFNFTVQCFAVGPVTELDITRFDFDGVTGTWEQTYRQTVELGLGTCAPFHLTYTLTNAADPTLWNDGFRSFTLDEPLIGMAAGSADDVALRAYVADHPCEGC